MEYFKKVSLDDSEYPFSICWPNGEDLCPDVLYEIGEDFNEQKKQTRTISGRLITGKRAHFKVKATYAMEKKRPKRLDK